MKQLSLIISSLLFIGTAFAEESCPCNPLIEIMVDEAPLTRENIQCGKPIYAFRITVNSGIKDTNSVAFYLNGNVYTQMSELNNNYGLQTVYFLGKDYFEPHEESISYSWKIEKFNGKKYIVHFHDDFNVYSSKDSQFIIAK